MLQEHAVVVLKGFSEEEKKKQITKGIFINYINALVLCFEILQQAIKHLQIHPLAQYEAPPYIYSLHVVVGAR